MSEHQELLSVVAPVYNEQEVIEEFHRRLSESLQRLDSTDCEIVYVNDGSSDNSLNLMRQLQEADPRVAIVDLSRNFGKEIAMTAGIHHARGDAVVIIDTDLQDPPELIIKMVSEWRSGYDVVYAKRTARDGETRLKKLTAYLFYRFMKFVGGVKLPADTGDFRLLSRRAVDALNQVTEQHRFMKGLFTWIGFKQKAIPYQRDSRFAGETKWNYWKLWNFALEGITSFTAAPLKLATYVGLAVASLAFFYGLYMIIVTLLFGNPVPGYPSLVVIILFLGGVQLTSIGVLGEYVGRIYMESKQRPLYFVSEYSESRSAAGREDRR